MNIWEYKGRGNLWPCVLVRYNFGQLKILNTNCNLRKSEKATEKPG